MLGAKRHNQLLVRLLLAALVEHTHVRLATVQRLGRLAESARKSVVDQRDAQNALECVQHGHLARGVAAVGADLDLVGGDGGVGLGLFSVRLFFSHLLVNLFFWLGSTV